MPEWFEDENFWKKFHPFLFNQERVQQASGDVARLRTLLGLEPGANVRDLCCGIGRHSIEFARQGFAVTGVDLTEAYLQRARSRAGAEQLTVEFIASDMRDFVRPASFDGAVNLFTSFGYFDDPAENLTVLANACASLRPDAKFVIDVLGREILARRFRERDWDYGPDGSLMLQEHRLRNGWDHIDNRWIVIAGTERTEFAFSHWLYSGAELRAMLIEAGFAAVTLYGSLAGIPYDHRAERLVAVAVK